MLQIGEVTKSESCGGAILSGNEKAWTAVLYVLTVVYTAFCCLILGWLLATESGGVEALVAFGESYGTLLTGIPVLITVIVAKQQLDANRRQHVANVKRGLRRELDLLDQMSDYADWALKFEMQPEFKGDIATIVAPYTGPDINAETIADVFANSKLTDAFTKIAEKSFRKAPGANTLTILALMRQIALRREHYAQYWS